MTDCSSRGPMCHPSPGVFYPPSIPRQSYCAANMGRATEPSFPSAQQFPWGSSDIMENEPRHSEDVDMDCGVGGQNGQLKRMRSIEFEIDDSTMPKTEEEIARRIKCLDSIGTYDMEEWVPPVVNISKTISDIQEKRAREHQLKLSHMRYLRQKMRRQKREAKRVAMNIGDIKSLLRPDMLTCGIVNPQSVMFQKDSPLIFHESKLPPPMRLATSSMGWNSDFVPPMDAGGRCSSLPYSSDFAMQTASDGMEVDGDT